jgi:hypothetical protein
MNEMEVLGGLFQVWFLHAQATFWRYQNHLVGADT